MCLVLHSCKMPVNIIVILITLLCFGKALVF
jgi:hypothetical protein